MDADERITKAAAETEILRVPKQTLDTFGITSIRYFLLSSPSYPAEFASGEETVVREGRVVADRPRIVTPGYLSRLEGFSAEARRYFGMLIQEYGPDAPGLFYTYRNNLPQLSIVSGNVFEVAARINSDLEGTDPLSAIIKGDDEFWDVALLKFIHDFTARSAPVNLGQMNARNLLNVDQRGVPVGARLQIEQLFYLVGHGEADIAGLKAELDRWGVFEEYQDRFFFLIQHRTR